MTMLEKAARAACFAECRRLGWEERLAWENWNERWYTQARAVLEAVRMPNMSNWIDADCNEDDHPITVFSAIMDTYLAERKSNDPE